MAIRTVAALFLYLFAPCLVPVAQAVDLQSFRVEFAVEVAALSSSDIPPDIAEALYEGTLELRQQVAYDAPAGQLAVRTFSVPSGSPEATPMVAIQNNQLEKYLVDISTISTGSGAVLFIGTVAPSSKAPVNRAFGGATYVFSASYSGHGEPAFRSISEMIVPGTTLYSAYGAGLIEFGDVPNRPPVAVVPEVIETASPEVLIDASASYDPDGGEIDFKWRVPSGAASLRGCETPVATVQLSQGSFAYDVELLLTDSKGASTTAHIRINYVGR